MRFRGVEAKVRARKRFLSWSSSQKVNCEILKGSGHTESRNNGEKNPAGEDYSVSMETRSPQSVLMRMSANSHTLTVQAVSDHTDNEVLIGERLFRCS